MFKVMIKNSSIACIRGVNFYGGQIVEVVESEFDSEKMEKIDTSSSEKPKSKPVFKPKKEIEKDDIKEDV